MPVVNRNTPIANIAVPVPTPVQSKPKQQSAPPAVQQTAQPKPRTPHRPLSFGGENDEFGHRVRGVSAVILPWSPKPKKLQRPKRYGKAPSDGINGFISGENGTVGGTGPSHTNADGILADYLDDHDDPRAIIIRRDMEHRTHKQGWYNGFIKFRNKLMGIRGGNINHIDNQRPIIHQTPDKLGLNSSAAVDMRTNKPIAYRHTTVDKNTGIPLHSTYLTPEEHQRVTAEFPPTEPGRLQRKPIVVKYARPALTPTQKERANKVELVVLPSNIEGKKCGTCKYAKKHSQSGIGLYCFNHAVHMNVKSNWWCKLWDAKGVKRLQRKVVKYSLRSSNLALLLKQARSSPEDTTLHGLIADALDESNPDNKIAELIRKQYGHGQYGGQGETNNLWHDSFYAGYDGTHPYMFHLGNDGPFSIHLGHEGQPPDRFEPKSGENQRWILRATSRLPGSKDAAYNFEIPHEQAHEISQMFPKASYHISPKDHILSKHGSIRASTTFNVPEYKEAKNTEARAFEARMDAQERNRQ